MNGHATVFVTPTEIAVLMDDAPKGNYRTGELPLADWYRETAEALAKAWPHVGRVSFSTGDSYRIGFVLHEGQWKDDAGMNGYWPNKPGPFAKVATTSHA